MGDQRTIRRARKEFRRIVELNGGPDKFMNKPKRRKFFPIATLILLVLAAFEAYAIWSMYKP